MREGELTQRRQEAKTPRGKDAEKGTKNMSKDTELRRMNGAAMRDHLKLLREVRALREVVENLPGHLQGHKRVGAGGYLLVRRNDDTLWLIHAEGEMMQLSERTLAKWLARMFKEEF